MSPIGTVRGVVERSTHHLAKAVKGTEFKEQAGPVGIPFWFGLGHMVRTPFSLARALKQARDSQSSANAMLRATLNSTALSTKSFLELSECVVL